MVRAVLVPVLLTSLIKLILVDNHCTESPVVKSFIKDSSVSAAVGSSFGVIDGGGKGILRFRPTYLTSQKVHCWIYVGGFV